MRSSPSRARGRSRARNSITRSPTRMLRPCCGCAPAPCARCAASLGVSHLITSASAISGWPRSSSVTSGRASSVPPGSPKRSPRIPNTRMRAWPPRGARDRQAPEASMRRIAAICALTLALAARATDPAIKFEKYKLPNGLTVILSEDHRLPQVAVDIWYHVGAANQTPGRSGFAHLFEHMMFSGSKHVQPSPWQVLESVGASGVNGTTDFDRTNYFEVVRSNELAIVGDFDPKVAKELVDKYFGPIPRAADMKRPELPQPPIGRMVKETLEDKLAEMPRLILVWKGVRHYTDEEPSGDVLADVLGAGRTSRLYKALVFERQLASGVNAGNASYGLGGWFQITVTAARGHTIEEIRPVVDQIVVDLQQQGPTLAEVERAKRNIIANQLRTVERIGGFGGKADLRNHYETFLGA